MSVTLWNDIDDYLEAAEGTAMVGFASLNAQTIQSTSIRNVNSWESLDLPAVINFSERVVSRIIGTKSDDEVAYENTYHYLIVGMVSNTTDASATSDLKTVTERIRDMVSQISRIALDNLSSTDSETVIYTEVGSTELLVYEDRGGPNRHTYYGVSGTELMVVSET